MKNLVFIKNPRFWLAGPLALAVGILAMLGMAVWFPAGQGNIDNIILPLVLFPLIWASCFFFAYLAQNLKWVSGIFFLILVVNFLILWRHLAD